MALKDFELNGLEVSTRRGDLFEALEGSGHQDLHGFSDFSWLSRTFKLFLASFDVKSVFQQLRRRPRLCLQLPTAGGTCNYTEGQPRAGLGGTPGVVQCH